MAGVYAYLMHLSCNVNICFRCNEDSLTLWGVVHVSCFVLRY